MFAVQDFLAGTWTLIWQQGLGIGLIICFLAAAYFSPVFKKSFLFAAVVVGVFLGAMDLGVLDEKKHVTAQEQQVNKKVDKAVAKAKSPAVLKKRDPWDRKDY